MHDNSLSSWSFALVAFAPLFAACGGGVSSGVDGTRKGEDLSDEETQKVCQAIVDYGAKAITAAEACKVNGYLAASIANGLGSGDETIRGACNDAVTKCKAEAEDADSSSACDAAQTDPTCTAIVSDVETCASERIDTASAKFDKAPSCSDLSHAYFEDQPEEEPEPAKSAACTNTDDKCPTAAAVIAGSLFR